MEDGIKLMIREHIDASNDAMMLSGSITKAVDIITECIGNGNKILAMGNGGSASQASHFAAEFVGRYKKERKGLPCIALTTDTSVITAIGNDYGFEKIFERQIEALANLGDVVVGISTSGQSKNVILGLQKAKDLGCRTITLTGKDGREMKKADININISSMNTPRIQEMHIMILHIICEMAEEVLK